jgi:hypothetical protein
MHIYRPLCILLLCFTVQNIFCQYAISGKVLDNKTGKPVEYASVALEGKELWTVCNEKGDFSIKNIAAGEVNIIVSSLGYVRKKISKEISGNIVGLELRLEADNLALAEVIVTAKRKEDDITTSYLIDRAGLEHLQMLNVADAISLLPGGQTNTALHLATSLPQVIMLRSLSNSESGNPTFGTAIEVDGVRLSNNAAFRPENASSIYGTDTRNIATGNISSLEVIVGIPSVEYGDMTNGVVKINTRKGKSPWMVEMSTKPNTKQLSANKGFSLGNNAGMLNASAEYTKSIADLASPHTSYDRNALSLLYSNTFNKRNNHPVSLESSISGNIGGYNSRTDPDLFKDDYTEVKDNTFRANFKVNGLLNKSWITNLEANGSVGFSDNRQAVNVNKNSSTAIPVLHGQEEGYFIAARYDDNPDAPIVLIRPETGYWYQLKYTDSKPLNITANVKAKWARTFGRIQNHILLGTDFSSTGNRGQGIFYADLRNVTDSWREYRYDQLPFMNNMGLYAEEKITVPVGTSQLQLVAGIRSDNTFINHSAYGTTGSLSPRFNAKYTFKEHLNGFVKRLVLRAGWGKAVKLPSFEILYPRPAYSDTRVFSPGTLSDGTSFYAYHIRPHSLTYNPNLQWQYNVQTELGVEMKLKGVYIALSAYDNTIRKGYTTATSYLPFTYKYTGNSQLGTDFPIASLDRQYHIDRNTGVVSVSDLTGQHADIQLDYLERKTFKSNAMYINGSPAVRRGLEWTLDFDKIQALQTSVCVDGNYYYYHSTEETIDAYSPQVNMADGSPYQYVGFYVGGHGSSNGYETKRLTSNLTITTHIPAIRLIVSLRVEGAFYNSRQNLSEYDGQQRSFVLNNKEDYLPSASGGSIYNSNQFAGLYPLYYTNHGDVETKIPFAEKLAWAYNNRNSDSEAAALYNELTKLVIKSGTNYYFNENTVSGYYSANISITKEIGNIASISFNATNFTNNMQQVRFSDNNTQQSIYENGSISIPKFYYGLSLRLKL